MYADQKFLEEHSIIAGILLLEHKVINTTPIESASQPVTIFNLDTCFCIVFMIWTIKYLVKITCYVWNPDFYLLRWYLLVILRWIYAWHRILDMIKYVTLALCIGK